MLMGCKEAVDIIALNQTDNYAATPLHGGLALCNFVASLAGRCAAKKKHASQRLVGPDGQDAHLP